MVKGIGSFVSVGNGYLKMAGEVTGVERDDDDNVTGFLVKSFSGVSIYVRAEDVDSGTWVLDNYSLSSWLAS